MTFSTLREERILSFWASSADLLCQFYVAFDRPQQIRNGLSFDDSVGLLRLHPSDNNRTVTEAMRGRWKSLKAICLGGPII